MSSPDGGRLLQQLVGRRSSIVAAPFSVGVPSGQPQGVSWAAAPLRFGAL